MAPTSLFILACHICVQRLRSTVSGLREELYHRPWQYVPEASTTTTDDVLSPSALLFILLFAIDIKLQHTASTNMPNGSLCTSQHKCNALVPSSVDQHVTTQMFIHLFAPHLLHDNLPDTILPSSSVDQYVTTQMHKIDVTTPNLMYDIPRYATYSYSPPLATVSTSVQRQRAAAAGITSPSVVHKNNPLLQNIDTAPVHLSNHKNGAPPSISLYTDAPVPSSNSY